MEATPAAPSQDHPHFALAEGLKGIVMAFAMALVFRAFVVEGFEIPTGSMAPTLLGQHMLFNSPASGAHWPVGPIDDIPKSPGVPFPIQGATNPLNVNDPMTGAEQRLSNIPLRGGDRVFILKYLWPLYTPSRYDVVVFKNPRDPTQNYIKRLTGVGPEQVAIIDGDVFSRPLAADAPPAPADVNTWALPGWVVARKPESAQRAMWQCVFDSDYSPPNPSRDGRAWFRSPWIAAPNAESAKKWQIDGKRDYRFDGAGPTLLVWDAKKPILDSYPYNQRPGVPNGTFPVSDTRMSLAIKPDAPGQRVAAVWVTRGHEFRAEITGSEVMLKMRPISNAENGPWKTIGNSAMSAPIQSGVFTNLDFWHADQALSVFVNEKRIAHGEYDWTPAERIQFSLGLSLDQVFSEKDNLLARRERYVQCQPRLEFDGGAFTLSHTALYRDIHYQAGNYQPLADGTPSVPAGAPHSRANQPSASTHPRQPHYLAEGEYFFCGDNSPQSLDARLWEAPYPWSAKLESKTGVVSRESLIGRAFVVYWPGLYWKYGVLPIFDTGRVRQVR